MSSEVLEKLATLELKIQRSKSVNINNTHLKMEIINVGKYYFQNVHSEVNTVINEDRLKAYDSNWQKLIRLAHGNNTKKSYLKVIKFLKDESKEFNILKCTLRLDEQNIEKDLSDSDSKILSTLNTFLPLSAQSYQQGILDLYGVPRLSYRGTACEFREVLREVLDKLAPDDSVMAEIGFKLEKDQTKPTMKQKVRHILNLRGKRKNEQQVTGKSVELVESLYGEVTRAVYTRASISTHTKTTKEEVVKIKRFIDAILFDLLEIG